MQIVGDWKGLPGSGYAKGTARAASSMTSTTCFFFFNFHLPHFSLKHLLHNTGSALVIFFADDPNRPSPSFFRTTVRGEETKYH